MTDSPREETPSGFSVDTLLDAAAARIESLERRLQEAHDSCDRYAEQLQAALRETEAIRQLLAIHNMGGETDYTTGPVKRAIAAEAERDAALRKVEEHKRDAERYRYLREPDRSQLLTVEQWGHVRSTLWLDKLDDRIDAALAEKGKP